MSYLLFALFIGVPILEISVFISVGEEIGLGWTLATVILTAVIGTWMLKRQGLKTLFRLQDQVNQGQLPLREVFDGFCLLLAGAFLLLALIIFSIALTKLRWFTSMLFPLPLLCLREIFSGNGGSCFFFNWPNSEFQSCSGFSDESLS